MILNKLAICFISRVNDAHKYHIEKNMMPFLYAEEDRRMVRARKQHESDLALLVGPESGWDVYRRCLAQEKVFVSYSISELKQLLTDEERVSLGG